jgi:hypothetical protein
MKKTGITIFSLLSIVYQLSFFTCILVKLSELMANLWGFSEL